ncbi:MAG: ribosome maturation factor RimM [Calditrichota bacterium]
MIRGAGLTLPGTPGICPHDPVVIGRIARPVGLHGDLKVVVESAAPERFADMKTITLRLREEFRSFEITHCDFSGVWLRLHLTGVECAEIAGLLNGAELVIPASERIQLELDAYFIDDIVGCAVIADDGQELGFIQEIWHQGHHDLWVVDGPRGEIIVPAVHKYIREVDLARHRIYLNPAEGLWEES